VLGDAVGGDEFLCVLTQYFPDLVRCPDKEFALLAFTVRILRAVQFRRTPKLLVVGAGANARHFPHDIV
jgi:hypothetical protein